MENYWIIEEKFIFKPDFNEKIDQYLGIISKCNDIIFRNYNQLEIV